MPTYEYRCRDCGESLEVQQSFTDDALTTCPACSGSLRKIFGNVGISFKGSGFYKNDHGSRAKGDTATKSDTAASTTTDSSTSTAGASESKSEAKSETKSEPKKTETKKESAAASA